MLIRGEGYAKYNQPQRIVGEKIQSYQEAPTNLYKIRKDMLNLRETVRTIG